MVDVAGAEAAVNKLVKTPLTQAEFDALVDFVFNVGIANFTSSTMLKLLNADKHAEAANEFHKWDMAGGQHIAGLLRRRLAEANEFLGVTAA